MQEEQEEEEGENEAEDLGEEVCDDNMPVELQDSPQGILSRHQSQKSPSKPVLNSQLSKQSKQSGRQSAKQGKQSTNKSFFILEEEDSFKEVSPLKQQS